MKIKPEFVMNEIADEYIIVQVGDKAEKMNGVITLNETGAFLWKQMTENDRTEEELLRALLGEFKAEEEQAKQDIRAFLENLRKFGCLE